MTNVHSMLKTTAAVAAILAASSALVAQSPARPHFSLLIPGLYENNFIVLCSVIRGLFIPEDKKCCVGLFVPREIIKIRVLVIDIINIVRAVADRIGKENRYRIFRKLFTQFRSAVFVKFFVEKIYDIFSTLK